MTVHNGQYDLWLPVASQDSARHILDCPCVAFTNESKDFCLRNTAISLLLCLKTVTTRLIFE